MDLSALLDRPIAFHRPFVTITGSVTAALMLSQACYWMRRTKDPTGWFYKVQAEWEEETGLTRAEQETARKKLRAIGVLQERRSGVPARLFFKVNGDTLMHLLQTGLLEPSDPVCGNLAIKTAGKAQSITETTAESTSETTDEVPQILDTPEFHEAWKDYLQMRKEKKATCTPTTKKRLLKRLSKYPTVAVQALDKSTEAGWTGVFPQDIRQNNSAPTHSAPPSPAFPRLGPQMSREERDALERKVKDAQWAEKERKERAAQQPAY